MSDDPSTDDRDPVARRRPYPLAAVGLAALAVAGWGLAGSPEISGGTDLAWIVIAVGVVAGLLLILSGTRR